MSFFETKFELIKGVWSSSFDHEMCFRLVKKIEISTHGIVLWTVLRKALVRRVFLFFTTIIITAGFT